MTLKLVFRSDASCGPEELLLSRSCHGIGRLHDNDLSIQVDCVSGYHAELRRTPDGCYTIHDLESTNGTFLNGIPVTSSPERVKPGDRLKFGNVPVLVEEHIEVVSRPENGSLREEGPSQVVSLKDVFGFASGDHFNTFPITPIRPQPAMESGGGAPVQPVKMAPPVPTPAMVAQQIERAQHLERVQQLDRVRQIEQAREAERARQIEQAREAERVRQLERAKEAEQVRQIEQAKEAERIRQIEQAKEAERVRQLERSKEAEQVRQLEQAKEAERVRQLEQAREAERARQIEQAKEAERARQIEQAREAERARRIEQAKEAERARQIEQAKEAERVRQLEQAKEAERARQIEQAREAERVRQIEQAREAERALQIEQAQEVERARQLEQAREAERARQIAQAQEAERARQIAQAREAERARQIEQVRRAEPPEVNLQERPEPPQGMDFGSAIQSLTTQLESAMREISRLKASMATESPGAVERNGHGARPPHPDQPAAQGRNEQAARRPGDADGKSRGVDADRDPRGEDRKEVRAAVHTPPPLPGRSPENEPAFEDFGKLQTDSLVHSPERLGAARFLWRKICRR